jgi:hypothetical protein
MAAVFFISWRFDMRTTLIIALCLTLGPIVSPAIQAADTQPVPSAAAAQPYTTEDTALGDILDDAEAAAMIDKYVPGFSKDPQVEMARGMTLRQIQGYAADAFTDAVLTSLDSDFAALAAKRKAK